MQKTDVRSEYDCPPVDVPPRVCESPSSNKRAKWPPSAQADVGGRARLADRIDRWRSVTVIRQFARRILPRTENGCEDVAYEDV